MTDRPQGWGALSVRGGRQRTHSRKAVPCGGPRIGGLAQKKKAVKAEQKGRDSTTERQRKPGINASALRTLAGGIYSPFSSTCRHPQGQCLSHGRQWKHKAKAVSEPQKAVETQGKGSVLATE